MANIDYRRLVERLVTAIETHQELPWRRSWGGITWPLNLLTRKRYRGGNALLMLANAMDLPSHNIPIYMGFKQMEEWAKKTGFINNRGDSSLLFAKGSSPTWIKMLSPYIPKYEKERAYREGRDPQTVMFAKVVPVYNIGQMWDTRTSKFLSIDECLDANDIKMDYVDSTEDTVAEKMLPWRMPTVLNGQNRAFFALGPNTIYMPSPEQFGRWELYYAVLFHELGHSSGPALGRTMNSDKNSPEYWYEELIAELTSIQLLRTCGIPVTDDLFSHTGNYLKHYLNLLKTDPKVLFDAAAEAEKAAIFITGENTHIDPEPVLETPMEAVE